MTPRNLDRAAPLASWAVRKGLALSKISQAQMALAAFHVSEWSLKLRIVVTDAAATF